MLFLTISTDLRDRYKDCEMLMYAKQISETQFTPEDVVVLSEWTLTKRAELIQQIYRIRQAGARVIYIGPTSSETDEFKRQLCLMGVYDFAFFGDEIVLGRIDDFIENPRTPLDVKDYLDKEEVNETQVELPTIVDIFEEPEDTVPLPELGEHEDQKRFGSLAQMFRRQVSESVLTSDTRSTTVKKYVWPHPKAVKVRVLGDAGSGKSFLAWNLAAICNRNELPTAIVEENTLTITDWTGIGEGISVFNNPPKKGYRVILDTHNPSRGEEDDLYIVVTWPDKFRMQRTLLRMEELMVSSHKLIWVVNNHVPEIPLPVELDGPVIVIPNEPRQVGAARMKQPLVELDPIFGGIFEPVAERISDLFIQNAKGRVPEDVVIAGV